MKRAIFAAFAAAALLGSVHTAPAGAPVSTRTATEAERSFCQANYDALGPITGDCRRVPLWGAIEEDDPWGRWDCRTMGDHMCGDGIIWFNIGGQLEGYELNAPNRPACRVEPSNTREGFEVIFYMDQAQADDDFGFEVRCP